jgi:branched-chain amino acid transport system substrate-binding protein
MSDQPNETTTAAGAVTAPPAELADEQTIRRRPSRPYLKHVFLLTLSLVIGAVILAILLKPSFVPTVKIAVVLPLTGEDAVSGNELSQGVELARQKIQREGDKSYDYRVEVEVFDDQSTRQGAQQAALKIAADPNVAAVVGHFSSANTLAALPIYRTANLPLIMPVATLTTITRGGEFPNAFRLPPTNEEQAQTVVAFVAEYLKGKEIFIIHDDTDYSKNLAQSIDLSLKSRRLTPVGLQPVDRGTTNFQVLNQIAGYNPHVDVIVYVGYSPEAIYLAKQLGLRSDLHANLVLTDGVYGTRYRQAESSSGSYVVYQVPPKEMLEQRPAWKEYASEFQKRNMSGNPEGWAVWAYDGVNLARYAIEQQFHVSRVPRSEVVLGVLNGEIGHTTFRYEGALVDYEFNNNHDNKNGYYYVYQVANGEYTAVPWTFGKP